MNFGTTGAPPVAAEFEADQFLVEQLWRLTINRYKVSALAPDGVTPLSVVAFAEQKRMALREDFRFYSDESRTREVFRIKARRMVDIGGRYDVTDAEGNSIGSLQKQFRKSLVRSTWVLAGADETVQAEAREQSAFMAILRRVIDFVPYGEYIPLPYHFEFRVEDRVVGEFRRRFKIRDSYTLDLRPDTRREVDRRLAIALAVGLDALQGR